MRTNLPVDLGMVPYFVSRTNMLQEKPLVCGLNKHDCYIIKTIIFTDSIQILRLLRTFVERARCAYAN